MCTTLLGTSDSNDNSIGAIIGGVIGGVIISAIIIIMMIIFKYYFCKDRSNLLCSYVHNHKFMLWHMYIAKYENMKCCIAQDTQ